MHQILRRSLLPVLLLCSGASAATAGTGKVSEACTFNGIALKGKVQVVTAFPDIKVKVVTAFPDLRVQKLDSFPRACGQWQVVDAFPDFTVQIVDSFPDIEIQYVTSFPGRP